MCTIFRPSLSVALALLVPLGVGASPANADATPTPSACPAIASVVAFHKAPRSISGSLLDLSVTVKGVSARYDVAISRLEPGPMAVVRNFAAEPGRAATFTVRLGESHRFSATATATEGCFVGSSASADLTVPVAAAVTIGAVRTSPRTYTFAGRVQPADGEVFLFRKDASGRNILTSTAAVNRDGTYNISRHFMRAGRFGFFVVAQRATRHAGGISAVRSTVIF